MRPQDIVILLKIVSMGDRDWFKKDLASQLSISNSEVSESIKRSVTGDLLSADEKTIKRESLFYFLLYGIKHVFPAIPGSLKRGKPTAYSAPLLEEQFVVDDPYVWPAKGHRSKGIAIAPLYHTVPEACAKDNLLYELLVLVDALRIGKRNEKIVSLLRDKLALYAE